jgi:hypothetical protein
VEVGDLSSWEAEPDRAVLIFFRTVVAANKAGKAALKQAIGQAQRLTERTAIPISRHGF